MRTLAHLALTLSLVTAAAKAGAATGGARVEGWSIGGVAIEVAVESARFTVQRGGAEPAAVVLEPQGGVAPVANGQPVPRSPAPVVVAQCRAVARGAGRRVRGPASLRLRSRDQGGGIFRPG